MGVPAVVIDKIGLIHVANRRLLLARSRGKSSWYLPGGKRDPGETDVQTLVREIREELAVAVDEETVVPMGTFEAPADGKTEGTTVRVTCYAASLRDTPRAAAEIEEIAWVSSSDGARCSAVTQAVLAQLSNNGVID